MLDSNDRRYMKKALNLARNGVGLTSPNPAVGCVIVCEGKIVGQGWHEYALLDHAEVRALRQASNKACNSTVYVTLEPCTHHGRTPPCVEKLIEAGVRRVVVARKDPNQQVSGRGIRKLRAAGIHVDVGLMSEDSGALIEAFACHITTGLPFVTAKLGMSLDARIGTEQKKDRWITCKEAREFSQSLRLRADALLVGVGTILADDPELTYRGGLRKDPPLLRVVLDSELRTPRTARLFQANPANPILVFCKHDAPQYRRKQLENLGVEIVSVPSPKKELELKSVLSILGKRGILELLIEGGSRVHWAFLSAGLVDKFYFILAPLLLGGQRSVLFSPDKHSKRVIKAPKFNIHDSFRIGSDVVLEAYPSYSRSIVSPWLSR
jgi:diaminohydroxyphosphoribosylaminopyrimidine deaminase/5-amino-6-(5-phosphoribosylamino)uracil reductase